MKRQIVIELIKEFILKQPKRPYQEVEAYAKQLNASYEELQEAILSSSQSINQKFSKKNIFSFDTKNIDINHFSDILIGLFTPIRVGIAFSIISLIVFVLYTFSSPTLNPIPDSAFTAGNTLRKNVNQTENIATTVEKNVQIKNVYASEEETDAKRIFSISPSEVTLKFKGTPTKEVLGFYPYWMLDVVDEVNLEAYTSISLFGLEVDGKGNIITASKDGKPDGGWSMWQDKRLDTLFAKAKRNKIKMFITIKSFKNENIEKLVASDEYQKTFIANAIQLVNSKSLDGINIDFEYIGKASDQTMDGFTRLIANLNSELKRQIPNAQLSIDTYLSSAATSEFFDVQLLQDYVDSFVIMGYDVHTPYSEAGSIAPMEGSNGVLGYMQSYLERVPSTKLILAVSQYGYDWPITGKRNAQTGDSITRDRASILPYAIIAEQSKNYKIEWDDIAKTPYYKYVDTSGITHEVHYENARSLGVKYDFVQRKKLKGTGVWAIGYDGLSQEMQQLILEKFAN